MTQEEYENIARLHRDLEILEQAVEALDRGAQIGIYNPFFQDKVLLYYIKDDMEEFIREEYEKVKKLMDDTTIDIGGFGYV